MTANRPTAVIFDCDGVLVDSETVANRLLVEELARHGLILTQAEVEDRYVGGTMEMVANRARAHGAALPEDWVKTIYGELYRRLAQGVALIAGVEVAMDALDAAGVPYAVGSNGSEEKMAITLGQHPALLRRLHGRVFSARTLGRFKPDPALYLHAARELAVAPADCVVIDDSATGCTAGVRAEMRTLGFAEHDSGARLAAVGAEVFHRMDELPRLLGL